jgi:hypothetical protein
MSNPALDDLNALCANACRDSERRMIPTGLRDAPHAIGIGLRAPQPGDGWPNQADFKAENDGRINVLCHSASGARFMHRFVDMLESMAYRVMIDDDV